jgi:hypothetical protein
MAELAIPLIALGSMYVISKHSNNKKGGETSTTIKNEGFTNFTTPVRDVNYPILSNVDNTNVRQYKDPNQYSDKFLNNEAYITVENENPKNSVGGGTKTTYGLAGNQIDKDNFKHNNMVPYFGGKIRGASVDLDMSESILDNIQGQGSQIIRKKEQAPMFKPHNNLQHANGAPNMSDFMQSRVNPSMRMANIKPWEEERVAPGLNKGFTTDGGLGFNSGMEARESWLPKTVDELRVINNPKLTFDLTGHQGPANSFIKEAGNRHTQGKVEKNLPETYYNVGPERWFTTTGLEKAPTARAIETLNHVNRTSTTAEYYGNATNKQSTYQKGEYVQSTRPELDPNPITNAVYKNGGNATDSDYGINSYNYLPTNRSTMREFDSVDQFGSIKGTMKAVISPLMDVLRPSRKENVVGNLRQNGVAGLTVSNVPVFNPADRTRTTVKEMTGDKLDNNHLNINRNSAQSGKGYLVSENRPTYVQRDTTMTSYIGGFGGSGVQTNPQVYDAAYNQHNNVNKTYVNRPNQGGTQMFNQNEDIRIFRRDADRENNRMWVPSNGKSAPPTHETHGVLKESSVYHSKEPEYDRINPDILTAFKQNPYTQSLSSF